MLLQAYDNEDANAARAALNSPFIKHMDVEYAKLARGLPLPQQEYAVPPAGVRANAAEPYVSSSKQEKPRETVQAEVSNVISHCLPIIFFCYQSLEGDYYHLFFLGN